MESGCIVAFHCFDPQLLTPFVLPILGFSTLVSPRSCSTTRNDYWLSSCSPHGRTPENISTFLSFNRFDPQSPPISFLNGRVGHPDIRRLSMARRD